MSPSLITQLHSDIEHLRDGMLDPTTRHEIVTLAQARLNLLREEIRLREESQIPMIPRAAAERLEAADREIASLKRALWMTLRIAEHGAGPDTTPEQVLATLVSFIARKLAERQPPDVPLRYQSVLDGDERPGPDWKTIP